jgi:hypothetical protein|tara:strand:- start:264 stop:569 length:306 start_codon:yes stop_codon:yes gene_type:complete
MSQKTNRELRRKVKQIQVEWMHTLLPKEEADKITIKNIEEVLPKQQYYVSDRTMYLSFMNTKWVLKYLKKYPHINSFEELNSLYETDRDNRMENRACRSIL